MKYFLPRQSLMRFLSQLRPAQAVVKIRLGPGKSVKLTGKMVRAATGGHGTGFAELTRIKSVIGIKCLKVKFFPQIGSRQENPVSHTPR
ncbi:MAG: hypothetical protein Q8L00_09760 [Deltaproteobacteria bacterium]|nr:hypothetical protein [Deltaproteobacteria bacterium]